MHPGFSDMVARNWDDGMGFTENVARLAPALGEWNRNVFGNIHKKKKELWARLGGIQRAMAKKFNRRLLKLEEKLR